MEICGAWADRGTQLMVGQRFLDGMEKCGTLSLVD